MDQRQTLHSPHRNRIDTPAAAMRPPPEAPGSRFRCDRLDRVVIFSPGGAQGGAFAAQALANAASGGYEVMLHTRDKARFLQNSMVRCGDLSLDIGRHSHARISTGRLRTDPARTLIIDPTSIAGLSHTIAQTPEHCSVAYSQNGIPSHQRQKMERRLDAHTLISMTTSTRIAGQGIRIDPGGTILLDQNDPAAAALHLVMRARGFFIPKNVPDIHAAQYEKIAFNSAANIVCTLFGKTLGQLRDMCLADPRCQALVAGLAGEVRAVAQAQGIRLKPAGSLVADIHASMARFSSHGTSMRAAFDAGQPTEVAMLNGGIAALGRRWGVATPLNAWLTRKLRWLESMRDLDDAPCNRFHQRHAALVGRTMGEILEAASRRAGYRAA